MNHVVRMQTNQMFEYNSGTELLGKCQSTILQVWKAVA